MRLEIHVRPNAARTEVGGTHGGALVVRVTEPADKGRATAAALRAVADAVSVPLGSVRLLRGRTSRRKLIEIAATACDGDDLKRRVDGLLGCGVRR